ncbi:sortase [Streptomyces sp. N35]|uniref:sortase n=1 Tax=Streptomyces sp. N35 TaxID=2795730 RepID=UPI0018F4AE7F|nr:sortase [Streptomyces sp. N35]
MNHRDNTPDRPQGSSYPADSPLLLPANEPFGESRSARRTLLIGVTAAAVLVAAGVGYGVVSKPSSDKSTPASAASHTPAAAASSSTGSPDPLTGQLGGDPTTPDHTKTAVTDATKALASWSATNPAGTGSHAVGGSAASGSGGKIAEVLRIPALGTDWAQPVYQGVGDKQLRAGVGQFVGTERAGQVGNHVLGGHRSGVASPAFRGIEKVKTGATVTVTTNARITYTYKVTKISRVAPTDVNVIAQVPGKPNATPTKAKLTLVTCWPADGSSHRVVVEADLTSSHGGTR